MDIIEGLPLSSKYNCILVVVDLFTKYAHFIPLRHPFTAATVAQVFLDNIYRLHGLPLSMISDRDRIFTSRFWSELFKLAGVQLCCSTAYHPQSDGQSERLNQCLETYLRCFVHACPAKWSKWLATAEFWYNSSEHSAIGRSPFEALYGYSPRLLAVPPIVETTPASELLGWSSDRSWMDELIQSHLYRAKHRMKKQADLHRSERSFAVGDSVYLKLQPYVQTSLAPRSHQKLAFRFFGPFRITDRIGTVAYRLDLPPHSAIHPVFHVSQLKLVVGAGHQVTPTLPSDFALRLTPEQVLQTRSVVRGSHAVQQVLIKWNNLPSSLATWEDYEALRQEFPRATAWGQAATKGGGDVNSSVPAPLTEYSEDEVAAAVARPATASTDDSNSRPRKARPRKASTRFTGAEWTQ
jgi:hypothetical protein